MISRISLAEVELVRERFVDFARENGREMALVILDEACEPIFVLRTERCSARVLAFAGRKAFTAAYMGRDTVTFREENIAKGKTLLDWGEPRLTQLSGGCPIEVEEQLYGAIGVGGGSAGIDADLARDLAELVAAQRALRVDHA